MSLFDKTNKLALSYKTNITKNNDVEKLLPIFVQKRSKNTRKIPERYVIYPSQSRILQFFISRKSPEKEL